MTPKTTLTKAVLFALFATTATAQTRPIRDVIVTATRLPAPLAETPGAYLIDRADIEARQMTTAAQALRTVPGLSVFSNGLYGVASVRQRGAINADAITP